ncbi:hypothetical protein [Desertivirga xinjiangensis]|uniref:hypothetical protein n=1 Tax=Desertivirga xinjiangensis TaxID=539206 RepID=UPI00210E5AD6|nr:hypothetical protein [Pedobacter xinjiangensis]
MKPKESAALIKSVVERGWVLISDTYYPPNSPEAELFLSQTSSKARKDKQSLKTAKIRSGWIDDHRNLKNKDKYQDPFMMLIKLEFGIDAWPEFYFSTERQYRLDYALPLSKDGKVLKIGIEQNGGIWAKVKSGHSSGAGIQRDMDKVALAASNGWVIISRTPEQMRTKETLLLIKATIEDRI